MQEGSRVKQYGFRIAGYILLTLCVCFRGVAQPRKPSFPSLIPLPAQVTERGKPFVINASTTILCKDSTLFSATELLSLYISSMTGNPSARAKANSNYLSV